MSTLLRRVTVRHYQWDNRDGTTEPVIRIQCGPGFMVLPYDIARSVVDQVHDLCDERERELREEQT